MISSSADKTHKSNTSISHAERPQQTAPKQTAEDQFAIINWYHVQNRAYHLPSPHPFAKAPFRRPLLITEDEAEHNNLF